jgi:glyoxylase-like metal-dependent hydrolase (beta-lactamase superfamily II)
MLKTGTNGTVNARNFEAEIYKRILVKPFEPSRPDLIIEEEMPLSDFGVDGKIIFTPGHTRGSISILFGNNEAIIGDVMMGGIIGGNLFPSRPTYHYFFDDFVEIKTSIKKIIEYKPSKVYVGHGGPMSLEAVVNRFTQKI